MGDIEDQFSLDPDGFEELGEEEEIPEIHLGDDCDEIISARELNKRLVQKISRMKSRELTRFAKCKFNKLAMESIEKKRDQVHKFMVLGGIENHPDQLSLNNPPYEKKLHDSNKVTSWWRFVDEIIRDAFPEFNFDKFAINRIVMANIVIKLLIVPLQKGEKPNIKLLEKEFNAILMQRLESKQIFVETQQEDE